MRQILNYAFYFFLIYIIIPMVSFYSALSADPNEVLKLNEIEKQKSWVITIAKFKKKILKM